MKVRMAYILQIQFLIGVNDVGSWSLVLKVCKIVVSSSQISDKQKSWIQTSTEISSETVPETTKFYLNIYPQLKALL